MFCFDCCFVVSVGIWASPFQKHHLSWSEAGEPAVKRRRNHQDLWLWLCKNCSWSNIYSVWNSWLSGGEEKKRKRAWEKTLALQRKADTMMKEKAEKAKKCGSKLAPVKEAKNSEPRAKRTCAPCIRLWPRQNVQLLLTSLLLCSIASHLFLLPLLFASSLFSVFVLATAWGGERSRPWEGRWLVDSWNLHLWNACQVCFGGSRTLITFPPFERFLNAPAFLLLFLLFLFLFLSFLCSFLFLSARDDCSSRPVSPLLTLSVFTFTSRFLFLPFSLLCSSPWSIFLLFFLVDLCSYPPFYDEDTMRTYSRIMQGTINFPKHFSKGQHCELEISRAGRGGSITAHVSCNRSKEQPPEVHWDSNHIPPCFAFILLESNPFCSVFIKWRSSSLVFLCISLCCCPPALIRSVFLHFLSSQLLLLPEFFSNAVALTDVCSPSAFFDPFLFLLSLFSLFFVRSLSKQWPLKRSYFSFVSYSLSFPCLVLHCVLFYLLSSEAIDLCCRLLHPKPSKRFGTGVNGASAVKAHPWFKGFDWDRLGAGPASSSSSLLPFFVMFFSLQTANWQQEERGNGKISFVHTFNIWTEAEPATVSFQLTVIFLSLQKTDTKCAAKRVRGRLTSRQMWGEKSVFK